MITLSVLESVPPFAQGLVRDLRVRWALEEAGLTYEQRRLKPDDQASPSYRRLQPFGQVPEFEEDGLVLFESGSVVLHLGARSSVLLPEDPAARARATTWLFAALNTVEPPIQQLAFIDLFCADKAWAKERRPGAVEAVEQRLDQLSAWLGERDYLEGSFTCGDLMMTTVLRILRHTQLVAERPNLKQFQLRCEARPAFQRALQAQMAAFAPWPH